MSNYKQLVEELAGKWSLARSELPEELGRRVDHEFYPLTWEVLAPQQREKLAADTDYERDPDREAEREADWNLWRLIDDIDKKIGQLEAMTPSQPTEIESKDRQLRQLRERRVRLLHGLDGERSRINERDQAIHDEVERRQEQRERSVMKAVAARFGIDSERTVQNIVGRVRAIRGTSKPKKK